MKKFTKSYAINRIDLLIAENLELKQKLEEVKNSCDYYMKRSNYLVLKLAEKEEEIETLNRVAENNKIVAMLVAKEKTNY